MKRYLDLSQWNRKAHFDFFRQFDEPFYGICAPVDCTRTYQKAKAEGQSFYLLYMHTILKAVNATENLCLRAEEDEVVQYASIGASATVSRADGTFGFSYMAYHPDFKEFKQTALAEIERVENSSGLQPGQRDDVVHFSAIPWINFTSISHARHYGFADSVPKISVGKLTEENGRKTMPVSIHVHHGLADGLHVGQFFQALENLL